MIERLRTLLETDDGKKLMEEWVMKMNQDDEHHNRWVDKLKIKYHNNIDYVIEKLMDKYYSDEYVEREYKIGVQPREPLLWLVYGYAEKYGQPCDDEKYLNPFTEGAYFIGSYVIQLMNGQGAILKIDKVY